MSFYKVGLELLFVGGLQFAQELRHMRKRVFLDMKLLDIGNTVERAVSNAADLGVNFLTVHGTDVKTMRAAVTGRGDRPLKLLAVTVLTNLTADDLQPAGRDDDAGGARAAPRQAGLRDRLRRRDRVGPGSRSDPRGDRARIS